LSDGGDCIPVSYLLAAALFLASCSASPQSDAFLSSRSTPTPLVVVAVIGPTNTPTSPPPTATPIPDATQGIAETLATYIPAEDPEGSKGEAFSTLRDFADPNGVYRAEWWFADDGVADIYEVLAVVFHTEGDSHAQVQQAVAARYLWFCGGVGVYCSGSALINFLSYFQPWREPWAAGARFAEPAAQDFLPLAEDLVLQRPGVLTALIPGADTYVRDPNGLSRPSSIDWLNTPFHFANVHPTWDTYLRETLGRGSNGANRLWVLTMGEASRVCPSMFICENMTKERKP